MPTRWLSPLPRNPAHVTPVRSSHPRYAQKKESIGPSLVGHLCNVFLHSFPALSKRILFNLVVCVSRIVMKDVHQPLRALPTCHCLPRWPRTLLRCGGVSLVVFENERCPTKVYYDKNYSHGSINQASIELCTHGTPP